MKKIRKRLLAVLAVLAMVTAIMPQMTQQAYADAKTGTEYPYYGEDPTAYTPETITKDRTMQAEWSEILYPGDSLKFNKDEDGASPRFMGFSSTSELSADYGLSDGTTCITGEVNATGEILYIYDSIVLADDADYALYIYGNSRGGAGLKDDPDTLGINEALYGAYGISKIEKIPLYINVWYQLYGGSIPNGGAANPTMILNPKTTTFLKLNSAPSRSGEELDYWTGMNEWLAPSAGMPAGAVAINPVYPPDAAEEDFNPDYKYNGPYTNGVSIGLTAYYKPITYTIKIGDVSAYEQIYGSKGFLQWYDPANTYEASYIEKEVRFNAPGTNGWKVVGTDTRSNLALDGTVTAVEGTADYHYYGLCAQAPSADYILSGWSIKDSAGNELNDTYKLRMTKTYAENVNGVWNYLLCISTNGNYFNANLADGKTFVVTPIFTQKAGEDIGEINITMDERSYVGGDPYNAQEERATIASADAGKYYITKEQTTITPNATGYTSGDYIVEPGDTLYYTVAFKAKASEGYQFGDSVALKANGRLIATVRPSGDEVRFQDAIQQTASGGVTNAVFSKVSAGQSTWSITADFTGISRNKASMSAEVPVEYGIDGAPCTVITVAIRVNNGDTKYFDYEPAKCSGCETLTPANAASSSGNWNYTFKAGDEISWMCYGYNFREDSRMGWMPHTVGAVKTGSFKLEQPKPHVHTWDAGRVTKAATADAAGVKTYTCKVCKATKTATIARLGSNPNQKASDGTVAGKGASAACVEKAVTKSTSDKDVGGAKYSALQLRSGAQTNTSITLTWNKVSGATRYVIYGNTCNAGSKKYAMKKLSTIKGTAKSSIKYTKIDGKAVKKGTYYKFTIVALDKKNNVISTSKMIHVATKGGKVGNDKIVTIKAKVDAKGRAIKSYKALSSTVIKKGKSITIKASTTPVSKKLAVKKHRGIAFESSNTKIATVNSAGKITAKSKGSCYIYAYAQNGICRRIKITVK